VPSLTIDHFDSATEGGNAARALRNAGARAADELAGRTVWSATALPGGFTPAHTLRAYVEDVGNGLFAGTLEVRADTPLRRLAERVDHMLSGDSGDDVQFGPAERQLYRDAAGDGDGLIGRSVGPDDMVIIHDALTALLVEAIRERGAHAVWHVRVTAPTREAAAAQARAFLDDYTSSVDAYMISWSQPAGAGWPVDRVAALMPSAGVVAAKEIPIEHAASGARDVALRSVLADVLHADRDEAVGGTLHARPAVPPR
jgi:hypothetical protein